MTNEEKAREIGESFESPYLAALEMAEWKDEQFTIEKRRLLDKVCDVLRQTGIFDLLAANEGISAACMEDQFRKTMEEKL